MSQQSNVPPDQRGVVDLRSDTVTRPTPEMYAAMAAAPVGDDVLGDDPTVSQLESTAAQRVGMEAALFVPSGTMGNQIALACHLERGDAFIVEEESHTIYYECGGPAMLAQAVSWTLPSVRGVMDPEAIERRVLSRSLHTPGTTLLCLENTHNRAGGTIVPVDAMRAYREITLKHGMRTHLDGARVFNAAVGLGVDVKAITSQVDTVSFCFSKGLCAPVGSVLCGPSAFIDRAREWRKRLGGGLRQSGLLAACGLVSLNQLVDRLADDHARAKRVAQAIAEIPGLTVDLETVQTNIVILETDGSSEPWLAQLRSQGVWALPPASNRIRLVFHRDVDDDGANRTIEAFRLASA